MADAHFPTLENIIKAKYCFHGWLVNSCSKLRLWEGVEQRNLLHDQAQAGKTPHSLCKLP